MKNPSIKVWRFLEFASLPVSKADLASDATEARNSAIRAYAKGDKAHELLNSCNFDLALVRAWVNDYGVRA